MVKAVSGQVFLIICCIFYLIWWYRGYNPASPADKVGGINGILLSITAITGMLGIILTLMPVQRILPLRFSQMAAVLIGIATYIILMFVTQYGFQRIVTTELFLIVGWTLLEMTFINRLYAGELLSITRFNVMCVVIAIAFVISMVLYVVYYKMDRMHAFYAAMVPLITEGLSMGVLVALLLV